MTHAEFDEETLEYLAFQVHQEFGELIATAWRLPDEIKVLITDHHSRPQPNDPLYAQRLLLQTCDMILALSGYAPFHAYDLANSYPVLELGLQREDGFFRMLRHLPDRLADIVGELG